MAALETHFHNTCLRVVLLLQALAGCDVRKTAARLVLCKGFEKTDAVAGLLLEGLGDGDTAVGAAADENVNSLNARTEGGPAPAPRAPSRDEATRVATGGGKW